MRMRKEAIETLKENLCAMCAYGSQNMESCDIRGCDNRDAIKALEQEPKWIHVSERLPEDGEKVVVTLEDGDARTMTFYRSKNDWWFETDEGWEYKAMARAWIPSYKESEKA